MNIEITEQPIFVLGSPRSGTSMMQWALRQHPNLWGGPESDYLVPLLSDLREAHAYGTRRGRLHWLSRLQVTWEEFAAAIGHGVNSLYTERAQGKRWVEQTPQYTLHMTDLAVMFPGSRFLVMTRDGRNVVESLRNFVNPMDFDEACATWTAYNAAAEEFLAGPEGSRAHRVSYERAVTDTDLELKSLFDFVDEPFAREAADHITAKTPMNSSFKGEEASEKTSARWAFWSVEERRRFAEVAGEMLITLGYEADDRWVEA